MLSRSLASGIALALLAACGGPGQLLEVPPGQNTVRLTATNFAFAPSQIVAHAGTPLTLQVQNASGSEHNLTVADPAGAVLRSVALPPDQLVTVEVPLPSAGVYPFYCDKTFHPTLGMKGRIEAR